MDRGRGGSRGGGRGGGGRKYAARGSPATPTSRWVPRSVSGAGAHLDNSSSGTESSKVGKSSEKASLDGVTKKFDDLSSSDFPSEPNSESQHSFNIHPNDGSFKGVWNIPETEPKPSSVADIDPALPISSGLSERKKSCSPSHFIPTSPVTISCQLSPEVQSGKQTSEGTSGKNKLDSSDLQHNRFSFDNCEERSSSGVRLKTPLHTKNRAMRKEKLRAEGNNIKIIRPVMILLKGHISLNDQVGAGAHLDNSSSGTESSKVGKSSEKASLDGVTKKFDDLSSSDFPSEPNSESQHSFNIHPNDGSFKGVWNVPETEPKPSSVADIDPALPISSGLSERKKSCSPSHFIPTSPVTISCQLSPEVQSGKQTSEGTSGKNKLDSSDLQHNRFSFDNCEERSSSGVRLKTPLHTKNRAMRKEKLRAEGNNIKIIRPVMILNKGHISLNDQVGAGAHLDNSSSGTESSKVGKSSEKASLDGVTKKFDDLSSSDFPSEPNSESQHSFNIHPNDGSFKGVWNIPETEPKPSSVADIDPALPISSGLSERKKSCSPSHFIPTSPVTISCQLSPEVQSGKQTSEGTSGKNKLDSSDLQHNRFSFDICEERSSSGVRLKTPLHAKNRAMRKEKLRAEGNNIKIIRPGMILLKGHISLNDQVKMVKSCRDLGRGPGGFYQPGYGDGAKLHLKMMCLGKNWDPETSKYGDTRAIDQAKPPPIPEDFQQLVKDVVLKCHRHLELENKITNARKILPPMSPNICIINFYTRTGKLGLHQDKDESQESLKKGLPVVSVSLGDTAEFLFGDDGDVDEAEKVLLESGDVLIFGGESRHIFHGVSKIVEKTAPELLLEETRLKPGRVNLTFREY